MTENFTQTSIWWLLKLARLLSLENRHQALVATGCGSALSVRGNWIDASYELVQFAAIFIFQSRFYVLFLSVV